jgi:hypothetical protein
VQGTGNSQTVPNREIEWSSNQVQRTGNSQTVPTREIEWSGNHVHGNGIGNSQTVPTWNIEWSGYQVYGAGNCQTVPTREIEWSDKQERNSQTVLRQGVRATKCKRRVIRGDRVVISNQAKGTGNSQTVPT